MPRMRVCSQPGCPELTTARRCEGHAREAEQRRGSRQARGYDKAHMRERERWRPKVEACSVHCHARVCLMVVRLILPQQAWDLGHSEDRTTWTGPEHATCNRSAGGHAAHR